MNKFRRFIISVAFIKSTSNVCMQAVILISVAAVFSSCRKELSCEGCRDGNKGPIAIAGTDKAITLPTDSILLDGSASNDPDGKIGEWHWQEISSPAHSLIVNAFGEKTIVRSLIAGTYHFALKVTDDHGASASDTIIVTVGTTTTTNRLPVANAGSDQTMSLPENSVILDGSASTDSDNNITSYSWTKISGPSSFDIFDTNAEQTEAYNLLQGIYQFELNVIDAEGLSDKDTVQIIVIFQPVPCSDCKIVFVSKRDGNSEIYSCTIDGSDIRRLTNDPGMDEEPVWSPDGTRIAFISDRSGNTELYIMNADGSNVVRRSFAGTICQSPTWSPDGTKIAHVALSDGTANIWVVGSISGAPSLLLDAPGYDAQPAWSPDGIRIALVSDRAAYDFVYDIYMVFANNVAGITAVTGKIFDFVDYIQPSWSPNATKLAIAIRETIGVDEYNTQIGIMNPEGSNITVLTSGAAAWTRTSWSADGKRIGFTSVNGSEERLDVAWVATDGSAKGTIITNGWNANWQH
jgi:hypothetical protein